MMRPKWKFLLVVAVLAGTIVVGTSQADAYWGRAWYGPGWGYYGGYWGCSDCGYWGARPGLFHRAYYGPYRWNRGWGWDGCGCGCGWACGGCCGWDTCGSCCGGAVVGAVGCCGDGAVVAPSMTAPPPAAAPSKPTVAPPNPGGFQPAPTTPPALPPSTSILRNGSGLLTIFVPEDAKVFVNGYETKSAGAQRRYVSHGLKDGLTYKYEIRAELVRDGKTLEETRTVYLTSGAREGVAFKFDATKNPAKDLAVVF